MGAKRTKVKRLVLTDGTWYYDTCGGGNSYFVDDLIDNFRDEFEDKIRGIQVDLETVDLT